MEYIVAIKDKFPQIGRNAAKSPSSDDGSLEPKRYNVDFLLH